MGYIDETWYVGSDEHNYYLQGLWSSNVYNIICIYALIG